MDFYMIQTEQQLKKIIKEATNYSLLKELNFSNNNTFGMSDSGFLSSRDDGSYTKQRSTSSIKIDDEIITGSRGEKLRNNPAIFKKNQLIIESIFQIMECDSNDFVDFFKKSFTKSTIDEDFLDLEDESKQFDEKRIRKYLNAFLSTLSRDTNDKIGQYNAAYLGLKNSLESYTPRWTVLWCLFKDIKSIMKTDNFADTLINNDDNWKTEDIGDSKIYTLKDNVKVKLRNVLIGIINDKLTVTKEDVNELGTGVLGEGIGGILQTVLQFFFGDDIKDIIQDLEKIFNSTEFQELSKVDTKEIQEKLLQDPTIQKLEQGKADQVKPEEVKTFKEKAKSIFEEKSDAINPKK